MNKSELHSIMNISLIINIQVSVVHELLKKQWQVHVEKNM